MSISRQNAGTRDVPPPASPNTLRREFPHLFSTLSFESAREEEYQQFLRKGLLRGVFQASVVGCFIWLIFCFVDFFLLRRSTNDPLEQFEVRLLIMSRLVVFMAFVLILLLIRRGKVPRHVAWLSGGMMYLLLLGTLFALYFYVKLGVPHLNSVLVVLTMAMFLPIGLRLRESLVLVNISILTVVLAAHLNPRIEQAEDWQRQAVVMLLGGSVAALGAFLREQSHRRLFQLSRELEWQAHHDALTGLFNRRMFNHQLQTCISQAQRDRCSGALILLDVDYFKLYNDHYGHPAGDAALTALGKALQPLCQRPMDMAARVGGEEMALLLYDCNATDAKEKCLQLLTTIFALNIPHAHSPIAGQITVSAGCALLKPGLTETSYYQLADQLLYVAKHQGRNRIILGLDTCVETLKRPSE